MGATNDLTSGWRGWALVQQGHWKAPRYWRDGELEFTLAGLQPLDPTAPVRHLGWFEADLRPLARQPAAQRSGGRPAPAR